MDPFRKLPIELRLEILLQADNLRDASILSRASVALYDTWTENYTCIARAFTWRSIPTDVKRDYVALVTFPIIDLGLSKTARIEAVERHLSLWGQGRLPDPSMTSNNQLYEDILAAHSRIKEYANDYLGKATDPCLRRSYRYIPEWAHADFSRSTLNQILATDCAVSGYCTEQQLGDCQRRRILRAFVRYELLCKIYSSQVGKYLTSLGEPSDNREWAPTALGTDFFDIDVNVQEEEDYGDGSADYTDADELPLLRRRNHTDPFQHWNWNILGRYERSPTTFNDRRLMASIYEYIQTVYIALMQNNAERMILDRNFLLPYFYLQDWDKMILTDESQSPLRRRYPDDDPDDWERWDNSRDWPLKLPQFTASMGLDVLTTVLLGGRAEFLDFFDRLSKELWRAPPKHTAINIVHDKDAPCQQCEMNVDGKTKRNDLARFRRQTAWAVLDNSEDEYGRHADEVIEADYMGSCLHKPACGMACIETMYHCGRYAIYPSLGSKMVRFWKQG